MGLGLPLAPVDVIGGGFAGAGIGYGVEAITAGALVGVVEPVLLGVYFGWLGGVALAIGWEIRNIVKLVQNGFLIKVIAQAREGQTATKFMDKYLSKYKKDRELATSEKIAQIIAGADESGALCDGSLTKKGKKRKALRYKLADKKDLFTYIHSQLNHL
ncbi:MAG: hypothetical protein A2X86_21905 [Bdellovibrionales bacterium GWA2_49_15]|nr:MAG: hypothetical protein A2X86_21905 [Bdellovibrionales bacterium GWA2_49_15]HAZ12869.1 hypothetical protein [Bdellovibrionales bacterium]